MGQANGGCEIPLVVGANQRSSSLAVRDRLFVDASAHAAFLGALRQQGIAQALLVSTCDRVEVQAVQAEPETAADRIVDVLSRHGGFAAGELRDQLYVLTGDEAVRHIFAVAASLESTVIGEPHVLGQIKESYRASRSAGLAGGGLEAVIQQAFAVAKRVRTETAIGEGPVSVAAATVDLVRSVHGELDRLSCLLIGSGEMGEVLADALRSAGLPHLFVTDTRAARADAAARTLGCHVLPFEDLAAALGRADITIGCVGSRTPLVSAEAVRRALRMRRNRPIVLVDTAVPGDVDPLVDRLDGVFLYTLDDLERLARNGRNAREGAVDAAWRIVDEEVATFVRRRAERLAVPAMVRLSAHFEAVRRQSLADAGGDADRATRLLVNRLLHGPLCRLRGIAGRAGSDDADLSRMEELLEQLFRPAPEHDR